MTPTTRGRRSLTAALGLLSLLTAAGCSSAKSNTVIPATTENPTAVAVPLTTGNPAGTSGSRVLSQALRATEAVHSYRFSSVQAVGERGRNTSTLNGQALRPSSVSYSLTVNGKPTQVVRLPAATYLKVAGGRWVRLTHATAAVDPIASLTSLLRCISLPTASGSSSGVTSLHGTIPAAAARRAGLATGSGDSDVTVILDASRRVTSLTVSTTVSRSGTRAIHLRLITNYGAFNAVPPLKAPL